MQPPIELLHSLLESVPSRLAQLSEASAALRPAPTKWSPKEELGHLLDSAANNHQRIVRVQMQDDLAMPGYEQEKWVRLHAYQQREWSELIGLWTALNRQLLAAAHAIPESAWTRTCTIAGSDPMTLRFVLQDYVAHMCRHLSHIEVSANWANDQRPTTND